MWLAIGPQNVRALYILPPGLAQVTPSHIAALMGSPVGQVRKALDELARGGWIIVDEAHGWVYIPGACRAADNAKHLSKILKQATEQLENSPAVRLYLADVIGATYKRAMNWKKDTMPGRGEFAPFLEFFIGVEEILPAPLIPYGVRYPIQEEQNVELPHVERSYTSRKDWEDAPLRLLQALHPDGDPFAICAFGTAGRAEWQHFRNAREALVFAAHLDSEPGYHGVYWGLGGLREKVQGRGSAKDVVSINATWVDIDAKDEFGNRDPDLALEGLDNYIAARRVPPPSATVLSGAGVHAYWLLDTPTSGDELHQVSRINKALAEQVGGDDVADLARVLRIPGTMNRKYGEPCPCQIHELNLERRYSIRWLAGFLGIGDKEAVQELMTIGEIQFHTTIPSAWAEFLETEPTVMSIWKGRLNKGYRSEAAMSLANFAFHSGIRDPDELATILAMAPALGNWAREKPPALRATIAKALQGKR